MKDSSSPFRSTSILNEVHLPMKNGRLAEEKEAE